MKQGCVVANISSQRGHVALEWVMVTMAITFALFVPVTGENQSVASLFMESVRGFHENSSLLYSLP